MPLFRLASACLVGAAVFARKHRLPVVDIRCRYSTKGEGARGFALGSRRSRQRSTSPSSPTASPAAVCCFIRREARSHRSAAVSRWTSTKIRRDSSTASASTAASGTNTGSMAACPARAPGRKWTSSQASASASRSTGSSAPNTCSSISLVRSRRPTTACSRWVTAMRIWACGSRSIPTCRFSTTAKAARRSCSARRTDGYRVTVGIVPTFSFFKDDLFPLTVAFPTSVTVGPTDFWNRNDGTTNVCGPAGATACALSNFGIGHDGHPGEMVACKRHPEAARQLVLQGLRQLLPH